VKSKDYSHVVCAGEVYRNSFKFEEKKPSNISDLFTLFRNNVYLFFTTLNLDFYVLYLKNIKNRLEL